MNRDVQKPLLSIFPVLTFFEFIILCGVGCNLKSGDKTHLRVFFAPNRVHPSLLALYQLFKSFMNSKKLKTGDMDISGFRDSNRASKAIKGPRID